VTRRELLLALMTLRCSRTSRRDDAAVSAVEPSSTVSATVCGAPDVIDWQLSGISTHAVILAPTKTTQPSAVLVALHGRGEAVKGPDAGAYGWPTDYALTRALARVCAPPLNQADFEGLVTDEHLAAINRELASRPWEGLIVACPYVPDLDLRRERDVAEYGRFLVDVLLPKIRSDLPTTGAVGIDGVSLGGNVALRVGLRRPDVFDAVGALQPAIDDARVPDLVALAQGARSKHPSLALRITTSQDDAYRDVTRSLSSAWKVAGIAHDFSELPGPHDYIFNRGPGSYEMITWHRRVLHRG
jgi:poly(3-hydroxybutyrate) depolymerase